MAAIRKYAARAGSHVLPERLHNRFLRCLCGPLKRELTDALTDEFVQVLLGGMEVAFLLSGSYRKNIAGFSAVLVFRTKNEAVGASAIFKGGHMSVDPAPRHAFDTRVTFRDSDGLRKALLAGDQDLLDTILANPVVAEGNLSCLYRFGFLARELTLKLGIR